MLRHSDQYRGLEYVYALQPESPGATVYAEPSPDYFQYVDLGGEGLTPVGYGYRSIDYLFRCCLKVQGAHDRQRALHEIDREGIAGSRHANSHYNEQLIEAARHSILNGGITVSVGKIHSNGSDNFHRFSVEQRGLIVPLLHRGSGGTRARSASAVFTTFSDKMPPSFETTASNKTGPSIPFSCAYSG